MDIYALNAELERVAVLAPINVQWNRKYYECGDFAIQLYAENYSDEFKYVYRKGKELGLIQKVEYSFSNNIKTVMISGFFSEKELDDSIIYPAYSGTGTPEEQMRAIFNKYNTNNSIQLGELQGLGESVSYKNDGIDVCEMGKSMYEMLKTQQMSLKIDYDFEHNTKTLKVFKGKDRTHDQTENSFATFSVKFGNITKVNYVSDSSNYKNYFVATDASGGSYTLDLSNGGDKHKMRFNSGSNMTNAELQQYTKEQAEKYANITNFEVEVNPSFYEYGVDYDLGDICDVVINDLTISYKCCIIEIYEVYKAGEQNISLVLGDKIPTNLAKARLT